MKYTCMKVLGFPVIIKPARLGSSHGIQIALCDEEFSEAYIRAFIQYAESKYGDKIIGYWLLGGNTTEWFSRLDNEESHPVKLDAFRKYMGDEKIEIPSEEE